MTDPFQEAPPESSTKPDRCPACREPIQQTSVDRCDLCGFQFNEPDVTSEDHTPYAKARASGHRAWWTMCKWVFGAGSQRLAHLGLMRPSLASRRFVRVNMALLAVAVAMSVFANTGWHVVHRGPGIDPADESPSGKGWSRVLSAPGPLPERTDRRLAVALWWNVPMATVAATVAFVLTLVGGLLLTAMVGRHSQRALIGGCRGSPRLQCAVHYGTSWVGFAVLGVLISLSYPLLAVGRVLDWALLPSAAVIQIPSVLLTLFGAAAWWFWLVRLGGTVPAETRQPVSRYFVLWAPLVVILAGGGVAVGAFDLMHRAAVAANFSW